MSLNFADLSRYWCRIRGLTHLDSRFFEDCEEPRRKTANVALAAMNPGSARVCFGASLRVMIARPKGSGHESGVTNPLM